MLLRAAAALIAITAASISCSHNRAAPRDVRAEAAASAAQRLQGQWLLVSFQPAVPLELALQALLNAQLGHLVIEVTGANVTLRGPGVAVPRTYRIDEAYQDHFQATVYDSYGVGSRASGDFEGNTLFLNPMEAPWRGRGTLTRLSPRPPR